MNITAGKALIISINDTLAVVGTGIWAAEDLFNILVYYGEAMKASIYTTSPYPKQQEHPHPLLYGHLCLTPVQFAPKSLLTCKKNLGIL